MWHWCHSTPSWNTAFGLTKTAMRVTTWQTYPAKLSWFPKAQKCWNVRHLGIPVPANIRLRNSKFQGHRWNCHLLTLFCLLHWNNVHTSTIYKLFSRTMKSRLFTQCKRTVWSRKIKGHLCNWFLVKMYAFHNNNLRFPYLSYYICHIFLICHLSISCKETFQNWSSGGSKTTLSTLKEL